VNNQNGSTSSGQTNSSTESAESTESTENSDFNVQNTTPAGVDTETTQNNNANITDINIGPDFKLINKFDLAITITHPQQDQRAYFNLCHAKADNTQAIDYNRCIYRGNLPAQGIQESLTLTHNNQALIAQIRVYDSSAAPIEKRWYYNSRALQQHLDM
jgi:hypothetical protein